MFGWFEWYGLDVGVLCRPCQWRDCLNLITTNAFSFKPPIHFIADSCSSACRSPGDMTWQARIQLTLLPSLPGLGLYVELQQNHNLFLPHILGSFSGSLALNIFTPSQCDLPPLLVPPHNLPIAPTVVACELVSFLINQAQRFHRAV